MSEGEVIQKIARLAAVEPLEYTGVFFRFVEPFLFACDHVHFDVQRGGGGDYRLLVPDFVLGVVYAEILYIRDVLSEKLRDLFRVFCFSGASQRVDRLEHRKTVRIESFTADRVVDLQQAHHLVEIGAVAGELVHFEGHERHPWSVVEPFRRRVLADCVVYLAGLLVEELAGYEAVVAEKAC